MSTRSAVLSALRSGGGTGISGQHLADSLGISRVAVGKHVSALREAGYVIDARPGEGYRLISAPDVPLPLEVAPLLHDAFWLRVEGAAETGSTNDDARALARAGEPEGVAVVAGRQRSGRGRLGRDWVSPSGGVYLSAILRPPVAPIELGPLPLVVAVGVARGLSALGAKPLVKWPNDVFLAGGKVAGVLLEMSAETDSVTWVIAGVGVNVRPAGDLPVTAAHLTDEAPSVTAPAVAASVLDGISGAYRQWRTEGFGALRAEFVAGHLLQGEAVSVRDLSGRTVAQGVVAGVDETGRLLLQHEGGLTPISSGDVTLR